MKDKEFRRHIAYEVLHILSLLALLLFITRLWPILLLVILGILGAALYLLYWANNKVEPVKPILELPPAATPQPVPDAGTLAYRIIQVRITQILQEKYPDVRWVWENANAKNDILAGNPVYVLLKSAGGFGRARVILSNLTVMDVVLQTGSESTPNPEPDPAANPEKMPKPPAPQPEPELIPVDYGLLAFQWVETNILDLNKRINEALGKGITQVLIADAELPARESWEEICKELARNGAPYMNIRDDGILIEIKRECCGKE